MDIGAVSGNAGIQVTENDGTTLCCCLRRLDRMHLSLRRWFSPVSPRNSTLKRVSRFSPRLEALELRDLPSTVTWTNPAGGDWDKASNWSTGSLPTAADDVQINMSGITITHSSLHNDSVHSLTSQAPLDVTAGQLYLGSASTLFSTLALSTFGTITGPGTLFIKGLFTWTGGTMSGLGTTSAQAGIVFNGSSSETLDARTLNSPNHATWSGNTNIGLSDGAVINNMATGTFTVQNNQNLSGNGVFNNLGTLTKSIAVSTTTISSHFNNSGKVQLSTGSLEVLPPPTTSHQLLVVHLYGLLLAFATSRDLGTALIAPLRVRLWRGKFR